MFSTSGGGISKHGKNIAWKGNALPVIYYYICSLISSCSTILMDSDCEKKELWLGFCIAVWYLRKRQSIICPGLWGRITQSPKERGSMKVYLDENITQLEIFQIWITPEEGIWHIDLWWLARKLRCLSGRTITGRCLQRSVHVQFSRSPCNGTKNVSQKKKWWFFAER